MSRLDTGRKRLSLSLSLSLFLSLYPSLSDPEAITAWEPSGRAVGQGKARRREGMTTCSPPLAGLS